MRAAPTRSGSFWADLVSPRRPGSAGEPSPGRSGSFWADLVSPRRPGSAGTAVPPEPARNGAASAAVDDAEAAGEWTPAPPARRLDRLDAVALLLATGLAVGLVLFDLGTRSLWIDEATTWATANQHGASLWHWLVHDGGNMLGYYALMHVVVSLFGSGTLVLRLPSAIAFVATVPCAYLLVRRLFDRRAALFAAFLMPASSSLVIWAQQARGYLPGVAFSVAAALALVVAVQDRRRWAWAVFVVTGALAAYMVLLTGFVVLAQLAALALLPKGVVPRRRLGWSCLALVAAFVPLAAAALHKGGSQLDWLGKPDLATYKEIGRFLLSSSPSALLVLATLAAAAGGLAVAVWRVARQGRSTDTFAAGLLVLWVLVPLALLVAVTALVQPVTLDRYTLPVVPAVSMLAAVGCSRIRAAPFAWAAAVALVALRVSVVTPTYGSHIEDWRGATGYVAAHMRPHDCLAFFIADGFTAFDYYELQLPAGHQLADPVLPVANWSARTPFVLDPQTFPASRLPAVVASCPRLWLVETHLVDAPAGPGVPSYLSLKYAALSHLDAQIQASYRGVRGHRFVGVGVILFERRAGAAPPRP